jgi:hypothetical protein
MVQLKKKKKKKLSERPSLAATNAPNIIIYTENCTEQEAVSLRR